MELHLLGEALTKLSTELVPLVAKNASTSLNRNRDEREEDDDRNRNEVKAMYAALAPRVVYLYENARARGFGDAQLEDMYEHPGVWFAELNQRLGAVGMRVSEAANGE